MKKWLGLLLAGLLLLNGCSAEKFLDDQVYVVDGGAENQADDFVDWIDGEGIDSFQTADKQPDVAAGDILLTTAPDGQSYYVMQVAGPAADDVIIGEAPVLVTITQILKENGQRQIIAQAVPFVQKTAWNQNGDIVAFGGGGHLTVYDRGKERLILEEELEDTVVTDFFWSPVDNNKMYIEQPDTAGGLYYVDPQKRVELYETKEKIYYKATLENDYYYATQWRSSETDTDGALYTVLADGDRKVIKIIGQGSYKDSYKKSVLLGGEDRFGLYYAADINQVSKGLMLTEEYVYDAKFIAGGRVAYVVRRPSAGSNVFELRICDEQGALLQTLEISGSSFYLSANGRLGYVSGPQTELIDMETLQVLEIHPPLLPVADESLMTTLRGAVSVYAATLMGQQAAEDDIMRFFTDSDKVGGMAQTEMQAREPESLQEKAIFYQAELDREHSLISTDGDNATCHITLNGMDQYGTAISEQLAWDVIKRGGQWQVVGLSTFAREQERSDVLREIDRFGQSEASGLPVALGNIHWRQVQYWQKDKSGLAGWLSDAAWAKADGDPGGIVVWLKRTGNHWQVEQIWYAGGWIYPERTE